MKRLSRRSSNTARVSECNIENNGKERKKICLVRKKRILRLAKEYLIDYTKNSNLHGIKYMGEKERTSIEKLFWVLIVICSIVGCGILIRKVWIKWNDTPVIVTFAETSTPVWQIPFPAVTVCTETKAKQTIFNYTKYFDIFYERNNLTKGNLTENELHLFEDVSILCRNPISTGRKFSDGNITVRNIIQVAPTIDEMLNWCIRMRKMHFACAGMFSPILTEEGVCYTFNTLSADELFRKENLHSDYEYLVHKNPSKTWTVEGGYPPSTSLKTYPHRGIAGGVAGGIKLFLTSLPEDLDYMCRGASQGFKVMLHNPAELPRPSQHYFKLPLSQEVLVAVKPKMMTTSEGLRSYDTDKRQCYFQNDRYLRYFRVYTQNNCKMECLTNFTYALCGCVHFGLPRSSNMAVCNTGSMDCVSNAKFELLNIEILSGMKTKIYNESILEEGDDQPDSDDEIYDLYESNYTNYTFIERLSLARQCHCLPACISIEYETETSQDDYNWDALMKSYSIPPSSAQWTSATIYFKEEQFITSRRSELYGVTDLLANFGGLLGLFMGFSILSIAEIVYFITLRLCCVLRKYHQKNSNS